MRSIGDTKMMLLDSRKAKQKIRNILYCENPSDTSASDSIHHSKIDRQRKVVYFEGWNECLFVISNSSIDFSDEVMTDSATSFKHDPESGVQVLNGFEDCLNTVITLDKQYDRRLIQEVCRELHIKETEIMFWVRKRK